MFAERDNQIAAVDERLRFSTKENLNRSGQVVLDDLEIALTYCRLVLPHLSVRESIT